MYINININTIKIKYFILPIKTIFKKLVHIIYKDMSFISENYDSNKYVSIWNHGKSIPEIIKTCSVQEFDTVLQLVADTIFKLRETSNSAHFQDILNRKIIEIQTKTQKEFEQRLETINNDTTRKFNIEIEKLQKAKQQLEISLEQSLKSYQSLNYNFENLQSTTTTQFEKTINSMLQKQKESYDSQNKSLNCNFQNLQSTTNTQFERTINTMLQKQKESYESQIQMLDNVYREQINTLQESLHHYTKQSINDQNSSLKGKVGETNFDTLVEQHTTWNIENTAGSAQHCDRFGIIQGCKTLFEIKNWTYNIPKKEIDKFKRDMEAHRDCPVGIFISLNTNIVGAPQDFFYSEITNSNQTLIYIQKFMINEPISLFSVIDSIIKLGNTLYNKSITSNIEENDIQSKIDSIKPKLVEQIKKISSVLNEINNNKRNLIEKVNSNHEYVKNYIDNVRFTFETIFNILFNTKEEIQEDIIMASPPEAKKAKSNKKSTTSSSVVVLEQ